MTVGGLASLAFAISCAPHGKQADDPKKVVKDCVLAPSQANSIQGKWASTPIKVSFKSGDWTANDIGRIQAGGATWNNFFMASKGFSIFDLGPAGGNQSNMNQSSPACASPTLSDGVVLYKRLNSWTKNSSAIAVTTTCWHTSGTGFPQLFNAIMEFNYEDFFGSAPRNPDLQSIALHELGHLLGLDHSCGPLGGANINKTNVVCPDYQTDPSNPLLLAVMFPTVFFDANTGQGEVKQNLQDNDQGRANCIYP